MRKYIYYIVAFLLVILFVQPLQAATSFTAEYFNNTDLSGIPVLTQTEEEINHDWGSGSPDSSININQFSARWTGTITTEEADYKFTVTSDDGVRLKVDGVTIIDQWKDQAPTTVQHTINLSAGDHAVVLEYYENGGGAMATLVWEKQLANSPDELTIMPLGDSITYGWLYEGAYRVELKNIVSDINFVGGQQNGPSDFTDREHEGHPGWRIDEIQSNVTSWLNQYNPEMVLLMIGTNDILQNRDLPNAPQRLSTLIDTITQASPNAEVIVSSIPPIDNAQHQQNVDAFNATIPGMVQQKRDAGKKVHFIDIHSVIPYEDLPDTFHPNQSGYIKMAQKWKEAIDIVISGSTPDIPEEPTPTDIPTPTPTGEGPITAEYFNNTSLSGVPVLVRNETTINNDWGAGSPHASINNDNFSARWTEIRNFAAGTYKFTVTADDGIRLKIDGVTVIDKWIDQAPTSYSYEADLTAGEHTIIVEYYEKGYGAVAKLSIAEVETEPTPTDTPTPTPTAPTPEPTGIPLDNGFKAEYFNGTALGGAPILTRQETTIDNNWGSGSPHASIPTDNFSARWQGDFTFEPGTYTFSVTGDDGVRLKIDDTVIINKWINQGPTTYTSEMDLSGVHRVTFEYYESGGGAVAQASWIKNGDITEPEEPPTDPNTPLGFYHAEYFNNTSLAGTPILIRTESIVNNDWGAGSPHSSINNDNFSARWTYRDNFSENVYRFTVTADDGVRLKVDGVTVIDKWIDQGPTSYSAVVPLTEGEHTVIMEYYEKGYGAVAKLEIQQIEEEPSTPSSGEGAFTIEYFNNTSLVGVPVHTTTADTINFDWGAGSPHSSINNDNFSARASKTVHYEEGTYKFTLTGDDGIRLKVDGVTVIDKWIDQAPTAYSYQINLSEGDHSIEVEYYEKGYGAVLKLEEASL